MSQSSSMDRGFDRTVDYDRDARTNEAMYQSEHWLAWLFAIGAIVLGVIGVLRGFGLIGDTGVTDNTRLDGFTWLLPAIAAALLSFALHSNDHHRMAERGDTADRSLMMLEHSLGYLVALATIAGGVLGILVGFDVFNNGNIPQDGYIWSIAAIGGGVLVNTLHAVRHHQTAENEDYIVSIVESRVGASRAASQQPRTTPARDPGTGL